MISWPTHCKTCGRSYLKGEMTVCSSSFHCCRDCTWDQGRRTHVCQDCYDKNVGQGLPPPPSTPPVRIVRDPDGADSVVLVFFLIMALVVGGVWAAISGCGIGDVATDAKQPGQTQAEQRVLTPTLSRCQLDCLYVTSVCIQLCTIQTVRPNDPGCAMVQCEQGLDWCLQKCDDL